MNADSPSLIVLVVGLVLVSAFLTAVEAALSSYSRARAEQLVHDGRSGARRLAHFLDDPPRYLNTLLLLRLLAEVATITLGSLAVIDLLGERWSSVLIAIAIWLVISFLVIGVAARTLGRQHADGLALAVVGPLRLATRVLNPLTQLLILIGNAITPGKGFSEGPFASEAELREMVDLAEASSLIESDERAMIHSVFELGDTDVREVMVPRTDVVYIERHKTLRQAMSLFLRSGYSRVPVVGEGLDDIVGFAYLKDVSKRVFDRQAAESTEEVESMMRAVLHVPDSKPVDDLLREMQAQRRHIAVVVDEYGGTAGIVTIEDILEEIVGEITDEFDTEEVDVEALPDGGTRVSSRFPVDDLEDIVGVAIEDDEVDTIGGLMAKLLGKVPIPGSVVEVEGLVLEAEGTTGRRKQINTVRITPMAAADEQNESGEDAGVH